MDERSYLHDNERLLASFRPSMAVPAGAAVRSAVEGLVVGLLVWLIFFLLNIGNGAINVATGVIAGLLIGGLLFWVRYRHWAHSSFRVTTERMLLQPPGTFFSHPLHTVKWSQYQESYTGHKNPFNIFFGGKPLCIRHGTADAHQITCFPSLVYAGDLKHFLDKVDSAVRKNQDAGLKPFVAKPRGQRDGND